MSVYKNCKASIIYKELSGKLIIKYAINTRKIIRIYNVVEFYISNLI